MTVRDWTTRKRPTGPGRLALTAAALAAFLWVSLAATGSSFALCADGVLDAGEECDDGGTDPGDGCAADCTLETWITQVCSTALDGTLSVTSADTYVNTYYAAPAAESVLTAGDTEISLGADRGATHTLQVGDRLMIIQMQGAEIDPRRGRDANDEYGDGPGNLDRSGYKTITAGTYEIVVVVAAPTSGPISIRGEGMGGGLVHDYVNSRIITSSGGNTATGFQTYQVIRVPQYSDLTIESSASIVASEWDGDSGGIVAFDVLGTLTLNGAIDVSARGFRGGQGVGNMGGGAPGFKGEGVAGTPWQVYVSVNDILVTNSAGGYPPPDNKCVGAPGNAGGNARDERDAGGGGGGNGGMGGIGGRGRDNSGRRAQGRGGAPLVADAASLTLGGGGGGGNGDDGLTSPEASSGQSGGGAVLIRAGALVAGSSGVIHANGAGGAMAVDEGAGGGGGGGTIIVYTGGADFANLTLEANGGDGNSIDESDDGGGGGGGGGLAHVINSTNASASVLGGAGGAARSGGDYDGADGSDGSFDASAPAPAVLACAFDTDSDLDGVLDGDDICPGGDDTVDTDSDTIPDFCDVCPAGDDTVDTDGDTFPDACDICPAGDNTDDADTDGVPDGCDVCDGSDDTMDADVDGVPDGCDTCAGSDDTVDMDGDSVPDGCDVCAGSDDTVDADVDGVPDGCDVCAGSDDSVDMDGDGVADGCDACAGFDDAMDMDSDGVADGCDACPGFDDATDTDADGVADGCDACPGFDDAADTDADGVADGCDVCPGSNDSVDMDGDGVADGCDACPGSDDATDTDGDGAADGCDACPGFDDSVDADADGVPDGCDVCPGGDDAADMDSDGIPDGCDVCPDGDNQIDTDTDGVPDGCDVCPGGDDTADMDSDGVPDTCDVCPGGDDMADMDGDGVPDACDVCSGGNDTTDGDMDGVPDECDACPAGDDAADDDGDGRADACDRCPGADDAADSDGDGVPDGCDACEFGDDNLDADGDGIADACDTVDDRLDSTLTGGACAASAGGTGWQWFLFMLAGLALIRRRRGIASALPGLAVIIGVTGHLASAHAQIALDQYQPPALASDGLFLATPATSGHLKLDAQLALDYANDPLVARAENSDMQSRTIVGTHLVSHVLASLGIGDRFLVFTGVPVHLAMEGDSSADGPFPDLKTDGGGLGDLYLGGRYVFLVADRVRLAAQLTVTAPTAPSDMQFAGSSSFTLHPQVLAQTTFGRFRLGANLGVRVQETAQLNAVNVGSGLTFALGASAPIVGHDGEVRVDGYLEFHGATDFNAFLTRAQSPGAVLVGAKVYLANGLILGAGLGPGVQRGIGAPDVRLLWSVAWSGRKSVKTQVRADRDRDGVLDSVDKCPDDPEDRDGILDDDGCMELDADFDGVLDRDDGAPLEAEDIDEYRDHDGVPDPDNDQDGFSDQIDECPDRAEDVDGVADEDGCPE